MGRARLSHWAAWVTVQQNVTRGPVALVLNTTPDRVSVEHTQQVLLGGAQHAIIGPVALVLNTTPG